MPSETQQDTFKGRRCLVTGGTRGIGLAICDALRFLGAEVIACSRSGGDDAVAADISTDEGRKAAVGAASERFGGALDVLVNNAGTNIRKPAVEYSASEIDQIVRTNMLAPLELCRLCHGLLKRGNAPAIVNTSSVGAKAHMGSGVVYAMTKAAVDQMTRYLAAEWARDGIRVNSVLPAYIDTPLVEPVLSDPARLKTITDRTPMGRVGRPEEVAEAVLALASPKMTYTTGQLLAVDGGMLSSVLPPP